jgi:hypothetical protein
LIFSSLFFSEKDLNVIFNIFLRNNERNSL